jgi:cardiolipin synthase
LNKVQLLATGPDLLRADVRAVEPVIEEIIQDASQEIQVMAYVLTAQAERMLGLLERAAQRGLKVTIIVNQLEAQDPTIQRRLRSMAKNQRSMMLVDFRDPEGRQLHAKAIVADRRKAVIGSANFSWGGMVTNFEIGVLVEGEAAWKLADLVDFVATTRRNPSFQSK